MINMKRALGFGQVREMFKKHTAVQWVLPRENFPEKQICKTCAAAQQVGIDCQQQQHMAENFVHR